MNSFLGAIQSNILIVSQILVGAISVGDVITGPGVATDTQVLAFQTGNGGQGTYILSTFQTVGAGEFSASPPLTGPPYPPPPGAGSNAIGRAQIGISPIGDIPVFDIWDTIESEYANSLIIIALIEDWFAALDQTRNLDSWYDNVMNVMTAKEFGLDVWGRIVGANRVIELQLTDFFGFAEANGPITSIIAAIQDGVLIVNELLAGDIVTGNYVTGPGVAAGTQILSDITGTGGAGTYKLSGSQTVAPGIFSVTAGSSGVTGSVRGFGQAPFYGGIPITSNYALNDNDYLRLILAKARANISDCSVPSINNILLNLFIGRGNCWVSDGPSLQPYFGFAESGTAEGFGQAPFYSGQNIPRMVMAYNFTFPLNAVDLGIMNSGVLPKPTGVSASINIVP